MRTASVKGNQARKILSFYRVNFGFTPPYKVLCDGETIALSLKNDLYLKQSLPTLLGSTAYVVVTECVLRDLRQKGEAYSNATLFARRVERVPCAHDGKLCERDCIVARLRKPLDSRLMLASVDPETIAALRDVPGVPLVTVANQTKLVLKPPPKVTLDFVQRNELDKTKLLSSADRAMLDQLRAEQRAARPVRKAVVKKKAKGPNPLSMKKAKKDPGKRDDEPSADTAEKEPDAGSVQVDGEDNTEESNKRRRKRKRKRTRGSSKPENAGEAEATEDSLNDANENGVIDGGSTPPAKRARTREGPPVAKLPSQGTEPAKTANVKLTTTRSQQQPSSLPKHAPVKTVVSAVAKKKQEEPSSKRGTESQFADVVKLDAKLTQKTLNNVDCQSPEEQNATRAAEGSKALAAEAEADSGAQTSLGVEKRVMSEVVLADTAQDEDVKTDVACEENSKKGEALVAESGGNQAEEDDMKDEQEAGDQQPAKKKQRKNRRRRPKKAPAGGSP